MQSDRWCLNFHLWESTVLEVVTAASYPIQVSLRIVSERSGDSGHMCNISIVSVLFGRGGGNLIQGGV